MAGLSTRNPLTGITLHAVDVEQPVEGVDVTPGSVAQGKVVKIDTKGWTTPSKRGMTPKATSLQQNARDLENLLRPRVLGTPYGHPIKLKDYMLQRLATYVLQFPLREVEESNLVVDTMERLLRAGLRFRAYRSSPSTVESVFIEVWADLPRLYEEAGQRDVPVPLDPFYLRLADLRANAVTPLRAFNPDASRESDARQDPERTLVARFYDPIIRLARSSRAMALRAVAGHEEIADRQRLHDLIHDPALELLGLVIPPLNDAQCTGVLDPYEHIYARLRIFEPEDGAGEEDEDGDVAALAARAIEEAVGSGASGFGGASAYAMTTPNASERFSAAAGASGRGMSMSGRGAPGTPRGGSIALDFEPDLPLVYQPGSQREREEMTRTLYRVDPDTGTCLSPLVCLKLLKAILEAPLTDPVPGVGLNFEKLIIKGQMLAAFPRHSEERRKKLAQDWGLDFEVVDEETSCVCARYRRHPRSASCWTLPWSLPLESIRSYFGEKVAFYFAFLSFYTHLLVYPSIIGIFIYAWQVREDTPSVSVTSVFGIIMALWSVLFTEYWTRREATTAFRWGMADFKEAEAHRPAFIVSPEVSRQPSPITGRVTYHQNPFAAVGKQSVSAGALILVLCAVIAGSVSLFFLRVVLQSEWTNYGGYAFGVINAFIIQTMGFLYPHLARWLTTYENQPTVAAFEASFVSKTVVFQVVNSFFSLFYIAFLKDNGDPVTGGGTGEPDGTWNQCLLVKDGVPDDAGVPDCMFELRAQLSALIVTRLIYQNAVEINKFLKLHELAWQGIKNCCSRTTDPKTARSRLSGNGSAPATSAAQSRVPGAINGPTTVNPAMAALSRTFTGAPPLASEAAAAAAAASAASEDKDDPTSNAEQESKMEPYDTYDDYMEQLILFGYATLFVTAFPLAPVYVFISNMIEVKLDAWKVLHASRRPHPNSATSIGIWGFFLHGMSMAAILTNLAVVLFTAKGYFFGAIEFRDKVIFFIVLEHVLIVGRWTIKFFIPSVPYRIQVQHQRQAYLVRKHIDGVEDENLQPNQEPRQGLAWFEILFPCCRPKGAVLEVDADDIVYPDGCCGSCGCTAGVDRATRNADPEKRRQAALRVQAKRNDVHKRLASLISDKVETAARIRPRMVDGGGDSSAERSKSGSFAGHPTAGAQTAASAAEATLRSRAPVISAPTNPFQSSARDPSATPASARAQSVSVGNPFGGAAAPRPPTVEAPPATGIGAWLESAIASGNAALSSTATETTSGPAAAAAPASEDGRSAAGVRRSSGRMSRVGAMNRAPTGQAMPVIATGDVDSEDDAGPPPAPTSAPAASTQAALADLPFVDFFAIDPSTAPSASAMVATPAPAPVPAPAPAGTATRTVYTFEVTEDMFSDDAPAEGGVRTHRPEAT